jgi:hypothetical protein
VAAEFYERRAPWYVVSQESRAFPSFPQQRRLRVGQRARDGDKLPNRSSRHSDHTRGANQNLGLWVHACAAAMERRRQSLSGCLKVEFCDVRAPWRAKSRGD